MTTRDPDRMIRDFLAEGSERLADPVYDAVRADIDRKPQRVVIGPWRMPTVNKLVPIGLGVAAVIGVLVVGSQLVRPQPSSNVGANPGVGSSPAATPVQAGGTVSYRLDGGQTTTAVDMLVDGSAISGTAVTTFVNGTHSVRLECAVREGDYWAVAGTTEATTVSGERAGDWSAVIVKEGSPQSIGIWVSDAKTAGTDCAGWLGAIGLASIDAQNFSPVESGTLVPPPAAGS